MRVNTTTLAATASRAQAGTPAETQVQTQPPAPEQGAAFVPKAGGPPDSSSYMTAGYIVTFVIYAGYIGLVLRRLARVRRAS